MKYTIHQLIDIKTQIDDKVKSMSFEELDALAYGTGFITLIEEHEDFAKWLSKQTEIEQSMLTNFLLEDVHLYYNGLDIESDRYREVLFDRLQDYISRLDNEALMYLTTVASYMVKD